MPSISYSVNSLKTVTSNGSNPGAGGVSVSSTSGNFSTSSTSYVSVTNLSVTITTTGNPIKIAIIEDGSNNAVTPLVATYPDGPILLRNGSKIAYAQSGLAFVDCVSAGTYTYSVQIKAIYINELIGTPPALAAYLKMVAWEM